MKYQQKRQFAPQTVISAMVADGATSLAALAVSFDAPQGSYFQLNFVTRLSRVRRRKQSLA